MNRLFFPVIQQLRGFHTNAICFAVPKKKVSYGRKRTRNAPKKIEPIRNLEQCSACGHIKFIHKICMECYRKYNFETKLLKLFINDGYEINFARQTIQIWTENVIREKGGKKENFNVLQFQNPLKTKIVLKAPRNNDLILKRL